jgi:hypothetical protein
MVIVCGGPTVPVLCVGKIWLDGISVTVGALEAAAVIVSEA